jgi:hypothetical protein
MDIGIGIVIGLVGGRDRHLFFKCNQFLKRKLQSTESKLERREKCFKRSRIKNYSITTSSLTNSRN